MFDVNGAIDNIIDELNEEYYNEKMTDDTKEKLAIAGAFSVPMALCAGSVGLLMKQSKDLKKKLNKIGEYYEKKDPLFIKFNDLDRSVEKIRRFFEFNIIYKFNNITVIKIHVLDYGDTKRVNFVSTSAIYNRYKKYYDACLALYDRSVSEVFYYKDIKKYINEEYKKIDTD